MLGNQDRSLARVVLFLLCWPILSPLEVVLRAVYDDFTPLNEVRNFSHIYIPHFWLLLLDFLVVFDSEICYRASLIAGADGQRPRVPALSNGK